MHTRLCSFQFNPPILVLLAAAMFAAGCATSTVETRKEEHRAVFEALPPETQRLVDQGRIQVGMSQDAVFLAWGSPSEIVESQSGDEHIVTWIFHGQWLEETRYWTYREVSRSRSPYLERALVSDYQPRRYIRAEIDFKDGTVVRWRTLPRPLY